MLSRWAVAILLFLLSLLARAQQDYPFTVVTERDGESHRILARNDGPSPVSVRVALGNARNAVPDRPFPVFAVVPPDGGELELGRVQGEDPGRGYSFRTEAAWRPGDFTARHSSDAAYRLPYADGESFRIGQAPGGPITTHTTPESEFAVDIPMPEGTPVLAARDGVVIHAEGGHAEGGQRPELLGRANEVRILHGDGTAASYAHLAPGGVLVGVGQRVLAGTPIGLAGTTGYSSGPHLHFAVQTLEKRDGEFVAISLPVRFHVGNPPVSFEPRFGLLAKADYSSPGVVPGDAAENVAGVPALPSAGADGPVYGDLPSPLRAVLLAVPVWQWAAVLVAVYAFILMALRRRRRPVAVAVPAQRTRAADEPVQHRLSKRERLIVACRGDRLEAERLMEQEFRREPGVDGELAAERAIARLAGRSVEALGRRL